MANYRVHYTDDYGTGYIDVDGWSQVVELRESLNNDREHVAWDIWVEDLNDF